MLCCLLNPSLSLQSLTLIFHIIASFTSSANFNFIHDSLHKPWNTCLRICALVCLTVTLIKLKFKMLYEYIVYVWVCENSIHVLNYFCFYVIRFLHLHVSDDVMKYFRSLNLLHNDTSLSCAFQVVLLTVKYFCLISQLIEEHAGNRV